MTRESRSRTAKRMAASAAVALAITAAGVVTAAPAQAATTPAFEIFYGPNCAQGVTASRVYTGLNAGEKWINDTFNSKQWGSAGYGQRINSNAASVYVSNAAVWISVDNGYSFKAHISKGQCFNLNELRNRNNAWKVTSYF